MLFPKNRMKFVTTYQGKDDPDGWITLDIKGADLEGAGKVYLSMADIQSLRSGGGKAAEKLQQARSLLGSLGAEEEE
jgi:hypothetical protein